MSTADNYLYDLLSLLISRAQEAAQQAKAAKGTDEHLFHEGRALAYYEVVSTMIGQAEVFGVEVVSA